MHYLKQGYSEANLNLNKTISIQQPFMKVVVYDIKIYKYNLKFTPYTFFPRYFHSLQAAFYVTFLLCLSHSLLHASTTVDPTQYGGEADSLRGFCEIFTLMMVVFYMCEEINEMRM